MRVAKIGAKLDTARCIYGNALTSTTLNVIGALRTCSFSVNLCVSYSDLNNSTIRLQEEIYFKLLGGSV